jgi:hypothetical protein
MLSYAKIEMSKNQSEMIDASLILFILLYVVFEKWEAIFSAQNICLTCSRNSQHDNRRR